MSVFCDFLSIYQQHDPLTTPELNAGRVVRLTSADRFKDQQQVFSMVDEWGEIICTGGVEYTSAYAIQHEGSYDTAVMVKCEGGRVTLSGNVGRFGRPDNVFGYGVYDCVRIANSILRGLGLPEFTWGLSATRLPRPIVTPRVNGNAQGGDRSIRLDAILTRLDLTRNYVAGSADKLSRLRHYMAGMHVGSKAGKSYDSGVTWGEGSKYWYAKLYDKHADIVKDKHAPLELVEWCRTNGVGRFEVSLKTRYLTQHGLNYVGVWEDSKMGDVVFGRFSGALSKLDVSVDDFEEIPGRLGELAIAWRNGVDLKARLPRNTFYRYRKQLKGYGIDISERCDVSRLPMRFETVTLSEAQMPSWYSLPAVPLAA